MHFRVYSKYFYSKLDEKSKDAYQQLLQSWLNYETETTISGMNEEVNLADIVGYIIDDIPELFYIDLNKTTITTYSDNTTKIATDFKYSIENCKKYKKQITDTISHIEKLSENEPDKEKFLHDYFVENVNYTSGKPTPECHNIIGPMLKKSAVCEGISRAYKLLCDALGIPCVFIFGKTDASEDTDNHAWNIVRRDGKTYHVDVTWDISHKALAKDALYYKVTDDFIGRNHTWDKNIWPACSSKGELENNIIDVYGLNSLSYAVKSMYEKNNTKYILRFNKKFDNIDEVLAVIRKSILKNQIKISSLAASYISALDCAIVNVAYL